MGTKFVYESTVLVFIVFILLISIFMCIFGLASCFLSCIHFERIKLKILENLGFNKMYPDTYKVFAIPNILLKTYLSDIKDVHITQNTLIADVYF